MYLKRHLDSGRFPHLLCMLSRGKEYRWRNEDYLRFVYDRETTLIPAHEDDQDQLYVTGIIFTPHANWEEYAGSELYYLESPEMCIRDSCCALWGLLWANA